MFYLEPQSRGGGGGVLTAGLEAALSHGPRRPLPYQAGPAAQLLLRACATPPPPAL